MGRVYGFGVIGCGVIAPVHVEAIRSLPNAKLVAVCDIVEEKARKLAEENGVAYYTDYHDMLKRDDIDVVNVVTWSGTHADIGMDAADVGKHVIITKPIDISLDKIDRLIDICRRKGVKLGATHQFRSYSVYKDLKRAVDEGKFGKLFLGNAFVKWYRSQEYYDGDAWRGTFELDGGGALMNQSIHYIDLIQWIMGPVKSVCAYKATLDHDIEVEDIASASILFESGALGVIQGSTCIHGGLPARIEVHGKEGNVVVEGEKVIYSDLPDGIGPASEGVTETGASDPQAGLSSAVPAHAVQIADVLSSIEEGREPVLNGEEARKAVEIILAIYESARTGRSVDLPLKR